MDALYQLSYDGVIADRICLVDFIDLLLSCKPNSFWVFCCVLINICFMADRCREVVNHLSRIEGQLRSLKVLVEEEGDCVRVLQLAAATVKSFDSLKAKLVSSMLEQVLEGKIVDADLERIREVTKLLKS